MFGLKKLVIGSAAAAVVALSAIAVPMGAGMAHADGPCSPFLKHCITVNSWTTELKNVQAKSNTSYYRLAFIPVATIASPSEGDVVNAREVGSFTFAADVTLHGGATDREDGNLTSASLIWTTSANGGPSQLLGTGENLTARLYTDGITPYTTHAITLTATDSHGWMATDTVNVTVYLDGRIVF